MSDCARELHLGAMHNDPSAQAPQDIAAHHGEPVLQARCHLEQAPAVLAAVYRDEVPDLWHVDEASSARRTPTPAANLQERETSGAGDTVSLAIGRRTT